MNLEIELDGNFEDFKVIGKINIVDGILNEKFIVKV